MYSEISSFPREFYLTYKWKLLFVFMNIIGSLLPLLIIVMVELTLWEAHLFSPIVNVLLGVGAYLVILCMGYFFFSLFTKHIRHRVTPEGITFYTAMYRIYTPWHNIRRVGISQLGIYRPQALMLQEPAVRGTIRDGDPLERATVDCRGWFTKKGVPDDAIPLLFTVPANWQESDLGRSIKYYVPQIFRDETYMIADAQLSVASNGIPKNKMRKQQQTYICLTLFKEDISAIIQLFQKNLQDVEIVIDDLPISDSAQLEQFGPAYQAKSLIARGYYRELGEEDQKLQGERPLVELKINTMSAKLLGWKEAGKTEPEILTLVREALLRSQNGVHAFMIMVGRMSFFYLYLSLMPSLQKHDVNFILQILILIVGGMLLTLFATLLSSFILRCFKMEALVFLLPNMIKTTRVYGRRGAVSRLIVVLVVLAAFSVALVVAFRLLWR